VAESNTIIEETLQGIANVKAFTNEFFEINRYKEKTNQVKNIAQKGGRYRGAFASFIIFCLFGSIVAVIWFGVLMINSDQLSIGQLFTFVLYSVFIGSSVGGMADIYSKLQKAIGSTEHLLDILEEEKEVIGNNTNLNNEIKEGEIHFQNLSFSYPSRPNITVIDHLSFIIKKGQFIAM